MIFKNLNRILWFTTIVTLMVLVNAKTKVSRMKALVIYAQYPMTSITNSLRSYDIDYQEWDATKISSKEKLTPKLYDEGKRPNYYMVIVDGSLEVYNSNSNTWESAFSLNQWNELEEYEAINNVRRVIVNNFTKPKVDGKTIKYDEKQTIKQVIYSAHNDYTLKIFDDARVKKSAPLNSEGLVHSGLEYNKDEDKGIIPILYFKPAQSVTKKTLAAAIIDEGNGREIFSFFIQFSEDSLTSTMLNHLWITWASRNLIPGHRRIFFTPQIENVFLSTRIVDETMEEKGITVDNFEDALSRKYRATPEDFKKIIETVKNLNKNGDMNVGSKLQIELAFNGNGIHQYLNTIDTSKDLYIRSVEGTPIAVVSNKIIQANEKTTKTEKEILLEEIVKYWNKRHDTLSKDELFKFFSDINNRKEFNWVSNTFSNSIFINITHTEVRDEIIKNIEVAMHLGLINKELTNSEIWWSKGSIGTRGSLGFTDQTVVEALKNYNIHYGLGNMHRSDIVNQDDEYCPYASPFGDFYVIPRDKRLALRWASSPIQTIWLYKKFYNEYFGNEKNPLNKKELNHQNKIDWYKILDIESEDAVQSLLNLKSNPFVFNQANIRINDSKSKENNSILAQWLQVTIQKYNAYVYWPMISAKSDNIAKYFTDRLRQKECGVEYSFSHNETHILGVQVVSQKACHVPITVTNEVKRSVDDEAFTYEKYGTDPLTVWIDLPGEGVTKFVKLEPALSFNDRSFNHINGDTDFDVDTENTEETEPEEDPEQKVMDQVNKTTEAKKVVASPTQAPTPLAPASQKVNIKSNIEKVLNSRSLKGKNLRRSIFNKREEEEEEQQEQEQEHRHPTKEEFDELIKGHHRPSKEEMEKIIKEHRRPTKEEMEKLIKVHPHFNGLPDKFKEQLFAERFSIETLQHILEHIPEEDTEKRKLFEKLLEEKQNKEGENVEKRGIRHRRSGYNIYRRAEKNRVEKGTSRHRRSEAIDDIYPSHYISELESMKKAREAMNIKLMYINDNYLKKVKQQPYAVEEHADDQYKN